MKMGNGFGVFVLSLLLVLDCLFRSAAADCSINQPAVKTRIGTICGITAEVEWDDRPATTVNIFYGIPFAKPPLKNLRFKKPIPVPENQFAVINASAHKPSCHQYNDTSYLNTPAAKMWVSPVRYDEDCLYLNVWVPLPSAPRPQKNMPKSERLPVMLWIYGGSFAMGTAALEVYEGRYLAGRNNVIVASLNYRVGPFGFIYLNNEDVPGNMGLWDQRLAMKWVKENIEFFGGDPDRITLFGESAGAVSVSAHVVSPWSQNLFRNAIMESGSVFGHWALVTRGVSRNRTLEFMDKVGCSRGSLATRVECMRQLPAETLTDMHTYMYDLRSYFSVPFPPVVEDHFFPYSQSQSFRSLIHLKPSGSLMLGMNKNEGSYFMLYAFINNSYWLENHTEIVITDEAEFQSKLRKVLELDNGTPTTILSLVDFEYTNLDYPNTTKYKVERLEEISSDRSFKCPTIEMALLVTNDQRIPKGPGRRSITLPTYFYEFRYRTKSLPWPDWMGTIHGLEIDYVFGIPFNKNFQKEFYPFTDDERKLSDIVMQYWTNFARTGDPNLMSNNKLVSDDDVQSSGMKLKLWPEFDNTTQTFLIFDENLSLRVKQKPKKRKCLFWRRWYPVMLKEGRRQSSTCSY